MDSRLWHGCHGGVQDTRHPLMVRSTFASVSANSYLLQPHRELFLPDVPGAIEIEPRKHLPRHLGRHPDAQLLEERGQLLAVDRSGAIRCDCPWCSMFNGSIIAVTKEGGTFPRKPLLFRSLYLVSLVRCAFPVVQLSHKANHHFLPK